MEKAENKLAFQVQFWGLIGPLIALVTLFVILLKSPSQSLYLSIATIFSVFVSLKWKLKGSLMAFFALLLCYVYQYSEITPDEHLWHIGMSLSILTASAITALSLYEVEQLLQPAKPSCLEDEMHSLKALINEEKTKHELIQATLVAKTKQIESYEGLVESVKSEMAKSHEQHEKIVNELLQKQHQLSLAEEKYHEAEKTRQKLAHELATVSELEKSLLQKTDELNKSRADLLALKEKLAKTKEEPQQTLEELQNMQELKSTIELLSRERGRLETLLFRTQIDLHQKTQDLVDLPKIQEELDLVKKEKQELLESYQELQKNVELLQIQLNEETLKKTAEESKQKEPLQPVENHTQLLFDFKKAEGKYNQLREQFALKSDVLDATRKELFNAKEEFLRLQLEAEERDVYHLSDAELGLQKQLLQVVDEADEKIRSLELEIQELQKIITRFFQN